MNDSFYLKTMKPKRVYHNSIKAEETVYSDRLFTWNSTKYNKLCLKHFGDKGQFFDSRDPKTIENFLCDYLGKEILLVSIEEYENASNGYPYWRFNFKTVEKE